MLDTRAVAHLMRRVLSPPMHFRRSRRPVFSSLFLRSSRSLALAAFVVAAPVVVIAATFNVRDYGATGTGTQLDTAALNRAVKACAHAGGGTVYLPPGRYLSGTITLKSHVTLKIGAGATLLASENPDDYPDTPSAWGDGSKVIAPLIYAVDANNLTVTGRGTIDGQGRIWWHRLELASSRKDWAHPKTAADRAEAALVRRGRPQLIRFVRCRDVLIEHLNLRNSPEWNIHPLLCDDVRVNDVSIYGAPGSHNTDGINPEACRDVHISNCRIDTGDDCITLKSGRNELGRRMGRPDQDITITNCVMSRGHGGVSIGSEMSGGVRNVVISNCVFHGTDNGIRIKSQRGRGGVVEGVTASNIVMQDVPTPFMINMFYSGRAHAGETRPVDAGTPRFRDFLFSDITAQGARTAGSITGLPEMPVRDVTFTNVHVQAGRGFTCTNARDVTFDDVVIDTARGPALILHRATDIDSTRLRTDTPHPGTPLVERR